MQDDIIIKLFFERNEQAIKEMDSRYGTVFQTIAQNILHNQQDSEECINDAYLSIWNAVPPARPNPLLPFACKIVRNVALKRYEKNTATKRNSIYNVAMAELEECLASPNTVDGEIEGKELARLIESFLDSLSIENRVIFLRRYWFSDTYADIAKRVGLTEKNVSVRLTRTRQQLRQYLLEREVFV